MYPYLRNITSIAALAFFHVKKKKKKNSRIWRRPYISVKAKCVMEGRPVEAKV